MTMVAWSRRATALVWSLLVCPLIALLIVWLTDGDPSIGPVMVFFVIPTFFSLAGQAIMRRPALEALVLSLLAAVEGGVVWLILVLLLASHGVFDT